MLDLIGKLVDPVSNILDKVIEELGRRKGRADGAAGDAASVEFAVERAGESDEAVLGCSVGRTVRRAKLPGETRNMNND